MNKDIRNVAYENVKAYIQERKLFNTLRFDLPLHLERAQKLETDLELLKKQNFQTQRRFSCVLFEKVGNCAPEKYGNVTERDWCDLILSDQWWEHFHSLRVCDGELLDRLIQILFNKNQKGELKTLKIGRFDTVEKKIRMSSIKGSTNFRITKLPVKIGFTYYTNDETKYQTESTISLPKEEKEDSAAGSNISVTDLITKSEISTGLTSTKKTSVRFLRPDVVSSIPDREPLTKESIEAVCQKSLAKPKIGGPQRKKPIPPEPIFSTVSFDTDYDEKLANQMSAGDQVKKSFRGSRKKKKKSLPRVVITRTLVDPDEYLADSDEEDDHLMKLYHSSNSKHNLHLYTTEAKENLLSGGLLAGKYKEFLDRIKREKEVATRPPNKPRKCVKFSKKARVEALNKQMISLDYHQEEINPLNACGLFHRYSIERMRRIKRHNTIRKSIPKPSEKRERITNKLENFLEEMVTIQESQKKKPKRVELQPHPYMKTLDDTSEDNTVSITLPQPKEDRTTQPRSINNTFVNKSDVSEADFQHVLEQALELYVVRKEQVTFADNWHTVTSITFSKMLHCTYGNEQVALDTVTNKDS